MNGAYKEIPQLLHDARLMDVELVRELGLLKLFFSCLRRNTDGSPLEEPVELRLVGVTALAAYYSPVAVDTPPSKFRVTGRLQRDDCSNWFKPIREALLYVDSQHEAINMETACCIDWLLGSSTDVGESTRRLYVCGESFLLNAEPTKVGLFIACEYVESFSNGAPLDLDDWCEQFEAWWHGWQKHWDAKKNEDDEGESAYEDTFIPAGEDVPPDLAYAPPSEKCVLFDESDAPPELLAPITAFHEAHHCRAWSRMARVYPDLDVSLEERARQLQDRYETYLFGRWVYLRHVDAWWNEGGRACVVVRGVEHCMPDEDDPASNTETVISYGLRKVNEEWIIWTWSQGWPRYGSAPKLDDTCDWRDAWDLD